MNDKIKNKKIKTSKIKTYKIKQNVKVIAGGQQINGKNINTTKNELILSNILFMINSYQKEQKTNNDYSLYKINDTISSQVIALNFDEHATRLVRLENENLQITEAALNVINTIMKKICSEMMNQIHGLNKTIYKLLNPFKRSELTKQSSQIVINQMFSVDYSVYLISESNILSYDDQKEIEKNSRDLVLFNIQNDISVMINKYVRLGIEYNILKGQLFRRPTKEATRTFSTVIFILLDDIILGCMKHIADDEITEINVYESINSNTSLRASKSIIKILIEDMEKRKRNI
jgi:hypothetical protein